MPRPLQAQHEPIAGPALRPETEELVRLYVKLHQSTEPAGLIGCRIYLAHVRELLAEVDRLRAVLQREERGAS